MLTRIKIVCGRNVVESCLHQPCKSGTIVDNDNSIIKKLGNSPVTHMTLLFVLVSQNHEEQ